MKVTLKKESFLLAVTRSLGCVSNEKTISAIEGILIETLGDTGCRICAYDLEKGIKTTIEAEVNESGAVVINGQKLAAVIKFMPSDIMLETDESGICTLTSGNAKFQLHYIKGEDFPQIPEFSPERSFSIGQGILRKMINQTLFAASKDDSRPNLTGLYFEVTGEEIKVVGCNSYKLALRKTGTQTEIISKTGETELKFIVPGKTVTELARLIEDSDEPVKFSLTRKHIVFSLELKYGDESRETVLFSRLIDSNYIEYSRFIPKESRTFVTVDSNQLQEALERAALVTEEKTPGQTKSIVKFNFNGNKLNISAVSVSGRVYDELSVEKEGPDIEIGFSCKYLLEILKAADTDILKLSLTSPLMSMIIEDSESDAFVYLALPTKTIST